MQVSKTNWLFRNDAGFYLILALLLVAISFWLFASDSLVQKIVCLSFSLYFLFLLIKKLILNKKAQAVLGNHELNLLINSVKSGSGWYFDESPVQDGYFAPETPRNDSMGYTGGLTYQLNSKLGIDFSFLYLHFDEVDNSYDYSTDPITGQPNPDFGGSYKSVVFSPGIGITYGF